MVLIDGAHADNYKENDKHRAIQDQVAGYLGQEDTPYRVTLLIVSHAHNDHTRLLPRLVKDGLLVADWGLVVDPCFAWGRAAPDSRKPARGGHRDQKQERLLS